MYLCWWVCACVAFRDRETELHHPIHVHSDIRAFFIVCKVLVCRWDVTQRTKKHQRTV